ncbi:MAG TPA: PqqD family protein [Anaerolineaceae bacterium]|nr:PqqD family protein [Anaerolineaceae bacterium]HPN53469.1 PqqD family protein [Anaerolineaceae bacterium]
MSPITLQSQVSIPSHVMHRDLDGENVILDMQSGKYFGLNAVGARMWALMVEHGQLAAVHQIMLAEYAVPAERLEADLLALVEKLASRGLVEVCAS